MTGKETMEEEREERRDGRKERGKEERKFWIGDKRKGNARKERIR